MRAISAERTSGVVADRIIFGPDDVDLDFSPLRKSLREETFVLGAFNPGFTRLDNGNLLIMVRVAEALREPEWDDGMCTIRWTPNGYLADVHPVHKADIGDPRQFRSVAPHYKILGLTSLSWLLPVELTSDARRVIAAHYDKAIEPGAAYEIYGIEDARISRIDGIWYMTVCGVSPERHCTVLYTSRNGIDYDRQGIVLDHQNKDMCVFEGKVRGQFVALTRPLGEVYFLYPPDSEYIPGPGIHIASSPDALHWKPFDAPGIRARRGRGAFAKLGGGSPPILTEAGWLMLYHGVEMDRGVGVYRTYWALLDRDNPARILRLEDGAPLLEGRPDLTEPIADRMYLSDIVFTTGLVDHGDHYIAASGEADLACRITHLPKELFA